MTQTHQKSSSYEETVMPNSGTFFTTQPKLTTLKNGPEMRKNIEITWIKVQIVRERNVSDFV